VIPSNALVTSVTLPVKSACPFAGSVIFPFVKSLIAFKSTSEIDESVTLIAPS
jgi:hypothetical protein